MKKRIFSGVVALLLCLGQLPLTALADTEAANPTPAQQSEQSQQNPPTENNQAPQTDSQNSTGQDEATAPETPALPEGEKVPTEQESVTPDQQEGTTPEEGKDPNEQEGTTPNQQEGIDPDAPPVAEEVPPQDVPDGLIAPVQARAGTVTLPSGMNLDDFIASNRVNDGDIIDLGGGQGYINDYTDGRGGDPWIVPKSVTITNGEIYLRKGGMLLSGDLVLKNVRLLFTNGRRNAIMANGHNLTLDNVTISSGQGNTQTSQDVHIFCGGAKGFSTPSGQGTVIVKNGTSLNNIYAGNIVPYGYGGTDDYSGNARIVLEESAGKMGDIYACGAMQAAEPPLLGGGKADPPAPDAAYRVSGTVTIELYQNSTRRVDGETGSGKNAAIVYRGNDNQNSALNLRKIDSLDVASGNLEMNRDCDLTGLTSFTVRSGAKLSLANLSASEPAVGTFTGGGILVLGTEQHLIVGGEVTGKTKLAFGSLHGDQSKGKPKEGHIYVSAPGSGSDSFELLPIYGVAKTPPFSNDGKGNWRVPKQNSDTVTIRYIDIEPSFTMNSQRSVSLPVDVTYADGSPTNVLNKVKAQITVNGTDADLDESPDGICTYYPPEFSPLESDITSMEFLFEDGQEKFNLSNTFSDTGLEPKTYNIKITIPAENMEKGQERVLVTKLIIQDGSTPLPPQQPQQPQETDLEKAIVTVTGSYVYDGTAKKPTVTVQLGGKELRLNDDYTVTYPDSINAGSYTLTVNGKDTYQGSKTAEYTISPKNISGSDTKVTLEPSEFIFDGTPKTAAVKSVVVAGKTLAVNQDYTVSGNTQTNAGTHTVTVTGGGNYEGTKTATFKIKKLTSLNITATADPIKVPTVSQAAATSTLSATGVYDDGSTTALPNVTWSIEGAAPAGVSLSGNVLTVTNKAVAGSVTVKADVPGLFGTKSITINKDASAAESVKILKDGVELERDTIVIPTSGNSTRTYTAKVFDQYGEEMPGTVVWSFTGGNGKITAQDGIVTVQSGATSADCTLTAAIGGKNAQITIHVVKKQDAPIAFANKTITYGERYTPDATTTASGGTWSYSYSGVDGTNYPASEQAPTAAGKYTVTARYESDTHYGEETITLTIGKKDISVDKTSLKVAPKSYDGNSAVSADAISGVAFTGLVGGESLKSGDYTVSGTYFSENVHQDRDATLTIALNDTATARNYKLTSGTVKVTSSIAAKSAAAVLVTNNITREYDGSDAAADLQFTVEGKPVTVKGSRYEDAHVGAGKKIVLGEKTGADLDNYAVTYPEVTGTITAKPVEVTISGLHTVQYGEEYQHTASAALLPGDRTEYVLRYNNDSAKPQNVGRYTITVELSNKDYKIGAVKNESFEITKADLTAAAAEKLVRYNNTDSHTVNAADFGINVPGTWTAASVSGDDPILAVKPSTGADTLSFALRSGLTQQDSGTKAVYDVTFTPASGNYNAVQTTLTVIVMDKEPITVDLQLANWKYGDTPANEVTSVKPQDSHPQTNPTWSFSYQGENAKGDPYQDSAKPTDPGKYTVTAVYEDMNHKGSASAAFEITKSDALKVTGLAAKDKAYNNTTAAEVTGTIKIAGAVGSDVVTAGTLAHKDARFENAEIGAGKKITVTLDGALGGKDAWKYQLPTVELTAEITKPVTPGVIGQYGDNHVIVEKPIKEKFDSYSAAIKKIADTPEKLEEVMLKKFKEFGADATKDQTVVTDIQLQVDNVDRHDVSVSIIIPYPNAASNYEQYEFTVLHLKNDGTFERFIPKKTPNGLVLEKVTTTPFAISWKLIPTSSGGGSTSSHRDDDDDDDSREEQRFWKDVARDIRNAKSGEVIKAKAGRYTRMPSFVMDALRKHSDVSLKISWKGDDILIPAGKALKDSVSSYRLSKLASLFPNAEKDTAANTAVQQPITGSVTPSAQNPSAQAPSVQNPPSSDEKKEDKSEKKDEPSKEEEVSKEDSKKEDSKEDTDAAKAEPADAQQPLPPSESGSISPVLIGVGVALAAGLCIVFFILKKKKGA